MGGGKITSPPEAEMGNTRAPLGILASYIRDHTDV
jgi:hypothetical protein